MALEETKVHLTALGVPENRVTVSGIPIDPVFGETKDALAMRRKHGLDEDRFTILVSAGGFGVGPVEHIIQALLGLSQPAQAVVVCGRNEELRSRLASTVRRLAKTSAVEFKLLGFTTEMDELMTAADLFVGKPGRADHVRGPRQGIADGGHQPDSRPGRAQFRSSPGGRHRHPVQQPSRAGLQDRPADRRSRAS